MESRQCTRSVMARLMGLDELSPNQPVHKKQKVLSENYLRRVAAIGLRRKRSSHECHSFRFCTEEQKELKDAFKEKAKLLWKLETGLVIDSFGEQVLGNGHKFLRSRKEPINLPTKIVVLKPKLGKKQNATRCFPSSSFCRDSHSINKNKEFLCPEGGNLCVEEEEKKNVAKDVEPARLRFRRISQARQTGQRKNLSTEVSKSGSGDNYYCAEEPELTTISSLSSCDWKNHSYESFVAREARKEILERWKTTKKLQEVEVASWNRTLAEMLATPDQESSPSNSDFRLGEHGHSSQTGLRCNLFMRPPEKRLQHRFRKQGHNQKDGSEYRNLRCMVSQSVPCPESRYSHSVQNDCMLRGELKRKLEEKDAFQQVFMVFKSSNSYHSCPDSEHRCTMQEGRGVHEPQKNKLEEKKLSEQSFVVTKSLVNCVASASMVADISENHKEQHLDLTDCMLLLEDGHFSSQVLYASPKQDMSIGIFKEDSVSSFGSFTDPESLVNLEEAYQRSPNSVLEPPPFKKEISSSSLCCQDVDSNLHGLQPQLELLKSESLEVYSEGAGVIVSSDDDSKEGSVSLSGENEEFMRIFSVKESREFSYLADIFTEAGFHIRKSGTSYEAWHSLECPMSPAVFEMLEKKHGEQMSWRRSERRLLFDRINSELMAILKPSIAIHWKKPLCTRLCSGKNFNMIEDLWMLLDRQEKQANRDSSVKVLGKDDGWLELGDDIEVTIREIENSLIDQLAEEVISMESC